MPGFTYDHTGHLLRTWQQHVLNGQRQPEVLVSQASYNALGQLVEKNLHNIDAEANFPEAGFLQSVDFRYDSNGQLAAINHSALPQGSNALDNADIFGLELVREQAVTGLNNTPRYDGGLSVVRWQVRNPRPQSPAPPRRERSYRYAYDGVGRLTAATYTANASPGTTNWSTEMGMYNEDGISYDANGNILTLKRYTQNGATTHRLLDDLTYNYGTSSTVSNKLLGVSDAGDRTQGLPDPTTTVSNEYPTDANGNVLRDHNKNATYSYNALNKVARQQVGTSGNAISYTYDGAGTLLRRTVSGVVVNTVPVTQTFDYVDGVVYERTGSLTPSLASVPTPEGRAVPAPAGGPLVYEYHLRDHLGNLRVAFRAAPTQVRLRLTLEDPANEQGTGPHFYPRFGNVNASRSTAAAYVPAGTVPSGTQYAAAVTAAQAGPLTRLPVADGDLVHVDLFYFTPAGQQYLETAQPRAARPAPARHLTLLPTLQPLLGPARPGEAPGPAGRRVPALQLALAGLLSPAKAQAPTTTGPAAAAAPAQPLNAYLQWTLYNAEGQFVSTGRHVAPVVNTSSWQPLRLQLPVSLPATASPSGAGFLRLELRSDGTRPVYFDSLTLRHPRPAVLLSQEHHYYPFGMNLKGVAVTTPPTGPISKNQFNAGSELQDELLGEAGVYSTFFRSYDPAIGRFQGVDPLYNFVSGRQ